MEEKRSNYGFSFNDLALMFAKKKWFVEFWNEDKFEISKDEKDQLFLSDNDGIFQIKNLKTGITEVIKGPCIPFVNIDITEYLGVRQDKWLKTFNNLSIDDLALLCAKKECSVRFLGSDAFEIKKDNIFYTLFLSKDGTYHIKDMRTGIVEALLDDCIPMIDIHAEDYLEGDRMQKLWSFKSYTIDELALLCAKRNLPVRFFDDATIEIRRNWNHYYYLFRKNGIYQIKEKETGIVEEVHDDFIPLIELPIRPSKKQIYVDTTIGAGEE